MPTENKWNIGQNADYSRWVEMECSGFEKTLKKRKKVCKKVLTFLAKGDIMNKLIRTAQAKRTALNLENDTEQEKRKQETVIPNELSSCWWRHR